MTGQPQAARGSTVNTWARISVGIGLAGLTTVALSVGIVTIATVTAGAI